MDILETVKNALGKERDVHSIGKSFCGNAILCAHRGGYSGSQIIITAGIHARECYTAFVVLRQLESLGASLGDDGVYFIPLVNPDGALFFERGDTQGSEVLAKFAAQNREWKANAQGVDLNCNFDANYGTGEQNTRVVGPHGYVGEYPLCAPESRALAEFTARVRPEMTVSYHCMGGELYWEFFQRGVRRMRDVRIATELAQKIDVRRVDGDLGSAGGYKDWCVQKLGIPAVTIELIKRGSHPFKPSDFDADAARNADVPRFLLDRLKANRI